MIEEEVTIYRAVKSFPPSSTDYIPLAQLPGRRFPGSEPHKTAAKGLSVYKTVRPLMKQCMQTPQIGTYIARYILPIDSSWTLIHLLGVRQHFTLMVDPLVDDGDYASLDTFIDRSYVIDLSDPPRKEE